jgi:hypothetical protein
VHTLRNDPNLGNAQFTLGVGSAPANSLVWVVLGAGPCAQPGANLPVLCGPLFATPILGTLGPVLSGGVGACDGQGQFALPLPVAPNLCNATVSSQAVALCVAGGAVGTAMSNCLSWTLQCN